MYPAQYYDGKTAVPHAVSIAPGAISATGAAVLRIEEVAGQGVVAEWPASEIIPAGSLHDAPLQLRLKKDTGERLNISAPETMHFIASWLGPKLQRARMRKIWKWAAAAGIAWVAITLVWLNMNAVMSAVVSVVPESWEHSLGEQSKEQIARVLTVTPVGDIPWCASPEGEASLEALTGRLTAGDRAFSGQSVDVSVLDSKVANAFALPGRHIVITSAMIEAADNPDQLAGVLAHELGHVEERHSLKRVIRAYGIGLLIKMVAGQGELLNAVGGLGNTLVDSRFSREDEGLADLLAVERLARAGIAPTALAGLFSALYEEEQRQMGDLHPYLSWDYLSDHPAFEKRITAIRDHAGSVGEIQYTPAMSEDDWAALRNICAE